MIIIHSSHQESYPGENVLRKINYLLNYLNILGVDNNGIPKCSCWYTQLDNDYLNNDYEIPHAATTIIGLVRHHLTVMWHHKEDEDWGLVLPLLPLTSPSRSTIDWIVEINDSQLYKQNRIYNIRDIIVTQWLISCFQTILFFILITLAFLF